MVFIVNGRLEYIGNIQKNILQFFIYTLLVGFLGSLVVENYFAKGYVYVTMLLGFAFIVYFNYKKISFSKNEETLILFGVGAFLLVLSGFFFQDPDYTVFPRAVESQSKHLLPLLLLPMFYFIRKNISIKFLALCLLFGAFASFFITILAYFEGFLTHGARGGGQIHGSPIIYGNLSMLFGVLSLTLSLYFYPKKYKLFILLLIGGGLGILSSLFSGSRGGWIVLLTLPFFIIFSLGISNRRKIILYYFLFLVASGIFILSTSNMISYRINLFFDEINLLMNDPSYSGGSLGSRLVFWGISVKAFLSSPLIGIGAGEFYAFKKELLEAGLVPDHLANFKHAHNEYLSILSNHGLIGVSFYLFFFVWLLTLFYRYVKSSVDEVRRFGVLGVVAVFCYLEFSLTESFLTSQLGLPAFYFIISLLIFLAERYQGYSVQSKQKVLQ